MEKLKVFEAFAGVGSQSMALRNLGIDYEVVGISEVDKWALLSYDAIHNEQYDIELPSKEEMLKEFNDKHIAYNFSTNKSEIPRGIKDIEKLYKAHMRSRNYGDIRLINVEGLPKIDLFTYSYPCKNISIAGQQKGLEEGSGTQSSLVWDCFKIIEYCKPKYLLMENVKNLVGKKHKPQFDLICERLEKIGYNNYWKVLNGKDFGVPQNRERVMMVSIRKDVDSGNFEMPLGFPLKKHIRDILEDDKEKTYYTPNENFKLDDSINEENNYPKVLIDLSIKPKVRKNFEKERNLIANSKKDIYQCDCTSGWQDNKVGIKVTPTVRAMNSFVSVYCDYKIRKLIPIECWRLMGFSDRDFYKAKELGGLSNTKLYERAGRGIVVPMLEEIFRNLFLR